MSKVTSKLQVTIPKRIADRYEICPGDEVDWLPAGDGIRVVPAGERPERGDARRRLELFDGATARQRERQARRSDFSVLGEGRGWEREGLYTRGQTG